MKRSWMIFGLALVAVMVGALTWQRWADARRRPAIGAATQSVTTAAAPGATTRGPWRMLEVGLELGVFDLPRKSTAGDSRVRILRIDPNRFRLKLMNASAAGQDKPLTARQWCQRNGLLAAINASMYAKDLLTSISLMRTGGHVNKAALTQDKALLAFDPLASGVPAARLVDLEAERFADVSRQYGTLIQSIRMVSADGRNVWTQQPRQWSAAAIGMDRAGRILFIHCRSPYSVHDLTESLLALPIELKQAMYVEGGPEAQLYVNAGGVELEAIGSFETGFNERDDNQRAWPVPNVVGVARR